MEIRLILRIRVCYSFGPGKFMQGFCKNFSSKASKRECWNSNLHCHIDVQPGAAPLTMITGRNKLFSLVSVCGRQHSLFTNTGWTLLGQRDDTFQTSMQWFSSFYSHHLGGFNTFTVEFTYFKNKAESSGARNCSKCLIYFYFLAWFFNEHDSK